MKRLGPMVSALEIGAFAATPTALAQEGGSLPPPVRAYQQDLTDVCREIGGRGDFGDGFIQRADFDGDDADDYFLDTATVSCPPASASAGTCGSAGCVVASSCPAKVIARPGAPMCRTSRF